MKKKFLSLTEFRKKLKKHKLSTKGKFLAFRKKHPRSGLHSKPTEYYNMSWEKITKKKKNKYLPFNEWSAAVKKAGVQSSTHYLQFLKKHKDWPWNPTRTYKKDMPSWVTFLGKKSKKYPTTYKKWLQELKKLGILFSTEYKKLTPGNPKFTSNPHVTYRKHWKGWKQVFLDMGKRIYMKRLQRKQEKYMTLPELRKFVKKHNCKSSGQYQILLEKFQHRKRKKLPSSPSVTYKKQWVSFPHLFQTDRKPSQHKKLSLGELQKEVRNLGLKNFWTEYKPEAKKHLDWPSYPPRHYKEQWISWENFFGI